MKRAVRLLAAIVVVAVLTPAIASGVVLGSLLFLPLPATLPSVKEGVTARVTHVYDSADKEIATFQPFDTSIPVQQSDIPVVLKQAVVASEDKDFYSHGGVDLGATLRALWADINNKRVVQGGSTITQQYAKLAFTDTKRTISSKIREAILASQLDRQVDKDTVLYRYLGLVFFGEGAYGIGAAAESYFHKPVSKLTLSEAALLTGVIPAPSRLSPRRHPVQAEARRKVVLKLMYEQKRVTKRAYDQAVAQKLWLAGSATPQPRAATVVYPIEPQETKQPWFTDYVRKWLGTHLPGCTDESSCPTLDAGGLEIHTTLDSNAQALAEQELHRSTEGLQPGIEMAVVSVEPPTGKVRAMVGGRDFKVSQVNTALRVRQPGSSFKPFVLTTALTQGISPDASFSGATLNLPDGTVVRNDDLRSYGYLPLRYAMWKSVNAVYGRLIQTVGVRKAMEMANGLGAPMRYDARKHGVSVALGAVEVSPLNMASAFSVFANHGQRAEPTPIEYVTDHDGKVIIDNRGAPKLNKVVEPVVADNVTDVLRGVLISGTAAGKGIDRPAAGKTGTSQDFGNAWFVGFTPTLSTAVWMGYRDCNCPLRGIKGISEVFGGTIPASTWQRYMKAVLKDVPVTDFAEPAPIASYADARRRAARGGFDPGPARYPSDPFVGVFVEDPAKPSAQAPEQTTSTTSSTVPDTTSTTVFDTSTTQPPVIN